MGAGLRRRSAKRKRSRLAPRIAAAVLFAVPAPSAFADDAAALKPMSPGAVVTLAADPFCPYNCEPDASHPGFAVELAGAAFADSGLTIRYVTMRWKAALKRAKDGRVDGVIAALASDAPDFVFPQTPVGEQAMGFLLRAGDDWRYNGLDSLRGRRIGLIEGYSYGDEADAFFAEAQGLNLDWLSSGAALAGNMAKLERGRIDMVIDDRAVIAWALHERRIAGAPARLALSPDALSGAPVYIAFTPSDRGRDLAARFDAGMARLNASGAARAIRLRYIGRSS